MSGLFAKYTIPGPRYTSYPTVPYWSRSPSEEEWLSHLDQSLQTSRGAALYVHIPFCRSLCTYCGCNTKISRSRQAVEPYIKALIKEWKLYQSRLQFKTYPLAELHLGGGTPTYLDADELKRLLGALLEEVTPVKDAEYSIEVDPRVTHDAHLIALQSLGFKRMSLGVQDFDPLVQKIVNREQSFEEVERLTKQARLHGFTSINYDLIYGLPLQTLDSIHATMKQVRELRPDRIAFYAYAHVPWIKPGQRKFTEADLPMGAVKRGLYEVGRSLLLEAGYQEIGMDHFALPTDGLAMAARERRLHRNFMGYTVQSVTPLLGLGVSSISDSWTAFAQNEKRVERYMQVVEEGRLPLFRGHVLNEEDLRIRGHILKLMTQFETQLESDEDPFLNEVPKRLHELQLDGCVEWNRKQLRVTEEGKPFLRNICMAFDAALLRKAPETRLFSQTI
jgi:oxygen-independent coproporphyrinogen III oxidase